MGKGDAPVRVTRRKLADYRKDAHNANTGSPRGARMLAESFRDLGAGRSLLADRDGVLIAGNHAVDGAAAAGIEDVIEIETDGSTVVVVKRVDLDLNGAADQRARRLALTDNRAGEVNLAWDVAQLSADPHLTAGLFRDDELEALLAERADAQTLVEQVEKRAEGASRIPGDPQHQIAPVLVVRDIAIVERALAATGLHNRGAALLLICRHYLQARVDKTDDQQP